MTPSPDDPEPAPTGPPSGAPPPLAPLLPADAFPAAEPPPLPPFEAEPGPSEPAVDLSPRPFQFSGHGAEYFRIWIVNVLLTVVTIGLYSAWAKVRRLRYFYGHTSVDGRRFGYHASPIAILKGRLIAYAVVLILAILSEVAPLLASVLYLPLLMVMPIVLVRAFRFRAANSSYGGIRFGFDGMESEAYRVFLFWPIAVPLTIGLAYPLVTKLQREFIVAESRLGRSPFGLQMPTARVYGIYVMGVVSVVVGLIMAMSVFRLIYPVESLTAADSVSGSVTLLLAATLYGIVLSAIVAVRTEFENLVWNHTRIDEHRFESALRVHRMLWLYLSNLIAIVLTVGLFVPWARVRLARYRAQSLTLVPGGPIVSAAAIGGAEDAASAAELSEAMDLDFGV
jgi:uncharacterized membrane protein YjgN (DUF898 family)